MRELKCRDAGFACKEVVRADAEEEVMAQAAERVRDVHGMSEIEEPTANHIRSQIQDAA